MLWDLNCLGQKMACYFDAVGVLSDVTFKRIDESNSGAPHDIYQERRASEKQHHTWHLKAVIDENPRKNVKGPMGAEVTEDIYFYLYQRKAIGGTREGEVYEPEHKDFVDYRGETYEVTRIERIHPTGASGQMAFRIMAKRYR